MDIFAKDPTIAEQYYEFYRTRIYPTSIDVKECPVKILEGYSFVTVQWAVSPDSDKEGFRKLSGGIILSFVFTSHA